MSDILDFNDNHNHCNPKLKLYVSDLLSKLKNDNNIVFIINQLNKKYKVSYSKSEIRKQLEKNNSSLPNVLIEYLNIKQIRSSSGVLVSTIVLAPSKFSCPFNCYYCPTETNLQGEPTQPKSYLSSEPAMLRASKYNFDVKGQIWDRIDTYIKTGNTTVDAVNKMEIIVSGGTWESYPRDYRESVIRDIYWACNTFNKNRDPIDLQDEIKENEKSQNRVVGLTIETRPDFINPTAIKNYRRWGVTRIQLGIQHFDDNILRYINRECDTATGIRAIKMLKQCAFKVVCHLMPDLPGSSPEKDKLMFKRAVYDPDLQFDDVKIYPTAVCKSDNPELIVSSTINEWYESGKYKPYSETNLQDLIKVLAEYKNNIQPWVRIQRLVRDIPASSIECGYGTITNLRQYIHNYMTKNNMKCNCIRCLEIGRKTSKKLKQYVIVRKYRGSDGDEYYISIEKMQFNLYFEFIKYINKILDICNLPNIFSSSNIKNSDELIGFCRFRIDNNAGAGFLDEIKNHALIREVHVYGKTLGISSSDTNASQHKGNGMLLVNVAEKIARLNNYDKIAVIAGVGVREYYRKQGYIYDTKEGCYQFKLLDKEKFDYRKKFNLHDGNISFGFTLLIVLGFIGAFGFIIFVSNYLAYGFRK